jgi:hypothetical protein
MELSDLSRLRRCFAKCFLLRFVLDAVSGKDLHGDAMKITYLKPVLAAALCSAALSAAALFVSGCVSTPAGGTTFGLPSKGTSTARYPRTVEQVVTATRIVLSRNGKVSVDNVIDNSYKAKINERDVWVKITKVDDKITQLVIMVRGNLTGDIDLAHDLDKQIALQLVNP